MNDKVFPFEYVGGGYFRRKGVPKGQKGETLHGEQATNLLLEKLAEAEKIITELRSQLTESP